VPDTDVPLERRRRKVESTSAVVARRVGWLICTAGSIACRDEEADGDTLSNCGGGGNVGSAYTGHRPGLWRELPAGNVDGERRL